MKTIQIKERNQAILDLLSKGMSQSDVARIFKLPRNTVHLIAMKNIMNEDEIRICMNWLRLQKIIKTMNKRYNSYSYKHLIEKMIPQGYISNDSFVEAVKRLDINYELTDSGRFLFVPISQKTIKKTTFQRGEEDKHQDLIKKLLI